MNLSFPVYWLTASLCNSSWFCEAQPDTNLFHVLNKMFEELSVPQVHVSFSTNKLPETEYQQFVTRKQSQSN